MVTAVAKLLILDSNPQLKAAVADQLVHID
jgi:hypothetical protein